jgi:DNA-binding NtrC family response regulator
MKPNIMIVDDSISVLESLQWIFKDEPFYLFAFKDPSDAMDVITAFEWAVVIAEQSMRKISGIEFLKRVREHSPQTMGIIMTNYNEYAEVLEDLYPDCDYQFIKTPLDNIEIRQAVKEAIAQYENTFRKGHEACG